MAKGGGGGGRGSGGEGRNEHVPSANATNGETHTVGGKKYDTGKVVNESLGATKVTQEDTNKTIDTLERHGNKDAENDPRVPKLATERAILGEIEARIPNSNILNQWGNGKWDITSANTITKSLNNYLGRRTSGIRARWTGRNK